MLALLARLVALALRLASLLTLAAAAASDVNRRIISNRTSLAAAGTGAALRLVVAPQAFAMSVLAAGAIYLALAGLANFNIIGGGDAKLAAAASLLVPAGEVPEWLLDVALAGGLVCLGMLATQGRDAEVPYGVAIAAATAYRLILDLSS